MPARKVVGRAVALKRGHYPNADGTVTIRSEGDTFDLLEGLEKSRWFQSVDLPVVKPEPPVKERKGKAPPKPDDEDLA